MSNADDVSQPIAGWHEPLGAADPRDVSLPLYGATFSQAIVRFFRGYVRFSGRASRSEYWWPVLMFIPVGIAAAALEDSSPSPMVQLVFGAVVLACALPGISLVIRRLHDANLSGWWCLLGFLPYLGAIVQIAIGLLRANPEGARFDRHDADGSGLPSF